MENPEKAPSGVKIEIVSILTGVKVRIGYSPTERDPMAQRGKESFYPSLEEALNDLDTRVWLWLGQEAK